MTAPNACSPLLHKAHGPLSARSRLRLPKLGKYTAPELGITGHMGILPQCIEPMADKPNIPRHVTQGGNDAVQ